MNKTKISLIVTAVMVVLSLTAIAIAYWTNTGDTPITLQTYGTLLIAFATLTFIAFAGTTFFFWTEGNVLEKKYVALIVLVVLFIVMMITDGAIKLHLFNLQEQNKANSNIDAQAWESFNRQLKTSMALEPIPAILSLPIGAIGTITFLKLK